MPDFILIADEIAASRTVLCLKLATLGYRLALVSSAPCDELYAWQLKMEKLDCPVQVSRCDDEDSVLQQHIEKLERASGAITHFICRTNIAAMPLADNPLAIVPLTQRLIAPVAAAMARHASGAIIVIHSAVEDEEIQLATSFSNLIRQTVECVPAFSAPGMRMNGIALRGPRLEEGAQCLLAQQSDMPDSVEHGEQLHEMANLTAYLVSDEMAFLTGAHIVLGDGRHQIADPAASPIEAADGIK